MGLGEATNIGPLGTGPSGKGSSAAFLVFLRKYAFHGRVSCLVVVMRAELTNSCGNLSVGLLATSMEHGLDALVKAPPYSFVRFEARLQTGICYQASKRRT